MGGTGYSAAAKTADGVSDFDALSLEVRIGIIGGIVVFILLVALAVWYLKRKHATYDRDHDGGITDAGGLHPEVVLRGNRKVTGRDGGAVSGRSARDLEAQFVNDVVLGATKQQLPPKRPRPTAAVRGNRPRPWRQESWGGSTVVAAGGDRNSHVGRIS